MMPRLKYLLSTMPRSLARVSRHTSPHSRAAPSSCSSSFPKPEEAPSSLFWGPSPSASAPAEPPEPEPSWPESVLPRPKGRLPASCWQCGQLLGSEARIEEMGCTSVWGVGSRGLCCGHSSEKQTESSVSVQTGSPPSLGTLPETSQPHLVRLVLLGKFSSLGSVCPYAEAGMGAST